MSQKRKNPTTYIYIYIYIYIYMCLYILYIYLFIYARNNPPHNAQTISNSIVVSIFMLVYLPVYVCIQGALPNMSPCLHTSAVITTILCKIQASYRTAFLR